ncbi:hypothetical protein C349_06741 [Cryptococcus neoformans var. grubii Br795]|uniref:TPR-like protein n=1 Tax=Cryptococcus neoformans Tu259-1 TaxID=1230072 RepID=A0A854Q4T1_CRYNE|nr:hypothetical protein C368_06442 [Cryptococcus neoformans var. grubii 125.91]OXG10786.1 hypothetical protein C361_06821 [Cryptococcus neoformans var. grubii Tu259-1]OXG43498.1 hypothetical protein C355_06656 [Cryptococcus neoformans var. grubii Th84]OXG72921.1 hypothetical protein C349_06741 [Cryptococcus neoformans var. grubii Br795]OXH00670.1 hypothetical protein J010_06642 [Cryptococcus neoformans var. grubii]
MGSFARSLVNSSRLVRTRIIPRPLMARTIAGPSFRAYATSSSSPSSAIDPSLTRAQDLLESGTRALEEGDISTARNLYKESVDVKETSEGWHNLANCEYHLQNKEAAIQAWEKSIALQPSADAHTNLASAYIFDKPPKPAFAIKHLTKALELSPEDPEIAFNLAAVLESTGNLDTALTLYKKAQSGGIERAAQNVRNVSAKLLGQKAAEQAKKAE